jgi:predicted Zn-dependent protease
MGKRTPTDEETAQTQTTGETGPMEPPMTSLPDTQEKMPKPDEYAELKHDLKRIAEKGKEALDEATPGREINAARLRLQSRYGTIVRTGEDGIPGGQFCGKRKNRKGKEQIGRFFIGLGCEVTTKDTAYKSELISKNKRVVNEFEATKGTAALFGSTVEDGQKQGDAIQRKIDEENYEYFPPVSSIPSVVSTPVVSEPASVDALGRLIPQIEEVIDQRLGAKLDKCEILAYNVNDCQVIAAADGTSIDVVNPMFALSVQVKTKDGNTAFGAIRGSGGGMEVLKRNHPERSYEEIVSGLAENIARDAINMDRAQGAGILGSECPVILGSHAAAVLIHEAYGHGMECDIVAENRRSKTAKISLKGRIGAQVADFPITVFDCGQRDIELGGKTFGYCWGSIPCDDHGQPPKRTVLIDRGVQVGVMSSESCMSEVLDGLKDDVAKRIVEHGLSGNSRAEKYDMVPLVRMTNTCLVPDPKGPKSLTEMAALVPKSKKGVYVHRCDGGWVNTETGDFVVKGAICFLVENGTITDKPIKGVTVSGNLANFGSQIKAIGTVDTIDDRFSGFCGKSNQYVPVDGIAPAIYVENAKLGGGSPWNFQKVLSDYLKQTEDVRRGKRDTVYIPEVDEIAESKDHSRLMMVCAALPVTEEIAWVSGKRDYADYITENGELKERGA